MGEDSTQRCGWVCPNDRGLTLLAKLGVGWSVKSQYHQHLLPRPEPLSSCEIEIINRVVQRAEVYEQKERLRIKCIVERVERLKQSVRGTGRNGNTCFLCGEPCFLYRIFSSRRSQCTRCGMNVCSKCSVESQGKNKASVWRCRICHEELDMVKKSGAWFYSVSECASTRSGTLKLV